MSILLKKDARNCIKITYKTKKLQKKKYITFTETNEALDFHSSRNKARKTENMNLKNFMAAYKNNSLVVNIVSVITQPSKFYLLEKFSLTT